MTDGPPLPPSSPLVQFKLLHSKFHLCSVPTRALLLSAYIKFINLFPETKATIQEVLRSDSQIRNSDVELQQRAVEYLKLSSIASTDVLVSALQRWDRGDACRPGALKAQLWFHERADGSSQRVNLILVLRQVAAASPRRRVTVFGRRESRPYGGREEGPRGRNGSVNPLALRRLGTITKPLVDTRAPSG